MRFPTKLAVFSSNPISELPIAAVIMTVAASAFCPQAAEDRSQARSMVVTRYGIVATEHP